MQHTNTANSLQDTSGVSGKAVRKIGLADQEFRIRMNRYEVTRYDAERIIDLASYGIIQLHLI